MKKRWLIILSVVGLLFIAGVVGAYFAMDYGVKRALDVLVEDVPPEAPSPSSSTVQSSTNTEKTDNDSQHDDMSEEEPSEGPAELEVSTSPEIESGSQAEAEGENAAETETEAESESESQAGTQTDADADSEAEVEAEADASSSSQSYQADISAERAREVENEISFSEKRKVTSVLLKSFNASDIRLLTSLAQGGLSVEDKREAKKLFLERLSPEEYNELIEIAANYGLSRGKTYEESVRSSKE